MKKGYERQMELLRDAAVPFANAIRADVSPATWRMIVKFGQICELFGEQKAMNKRAEDIKLFQGYDEDEEEKWKGKTYSTASNLETTLK